MVKHIVFMKFFDENQAAVVAEILQGLPDKIPEIMNLETGIDFLRSERSYDLALTVTFRRKEELNVYMNHPDHKQVQEYIHSVRESSISVDYEI